MTESTQPSSSPIEFPCDFLIKVMGKNSESLKANVLALAHSEFPQLTLDDLTERPSKGNKYLALSFTVPAENKEQLDRLYQKLTQAPEVIMAF